MRLRSTVSVLAFGLAAFLSLECGSTNGTSLDNEKTDSAVIVPVGDVMDVFEVPGDSVADIPLLPDPSPDIVELPFEDVIEDLELISDHSPCDWDDCGPPDGCLTETDCPPGWQCVAVIAAGTDVTYVCVDPNVNLCRPCKTHYDCALPYLQDQNVCLKRGPQGHFCTTDCNLNEDCPAKYECLDGFCWPSGGGECPCTEEFIAMGFETICYVSNENGQCFGTRTCDTECVAQVPAPETCNWKDDDCDGETDEGVPKVGCSGQCCELDNCDSDNDGWVDEDDNCPCAYNPGQDDLEGDGTGDVCDQDDDDDGVADTSDNCPLFPNPDQADCDDDGIGDACSLNCAGKECGDDGCGGVCGTCPDGFACSDGQCLTPECPCDGSVVSIVCGTDGNDYDSDQCAKCAICMDAPDCPGCQGDKVCDSFNPLGEDGWIKQKSCCACCVCNNGKECAEKFFTAAPCGPLCDKEVPPQQWETPCEMKEAYGCLDTYISAVDFLGTCN